MGGPVLKFLGAARTVTGSKYLLQYEGRNILIDCGLYQGLKAHRLKNWDAFPVDPKTIDTVLLTHAHIDHSGYIPRLIKGGFRGKVLCTSATLALARELLPDTGYLQEEEAEFLNRKKLSKHQPALPLFTREDAERALEHFVAKPFQDEIRLGEGLRVRFLYAGHILGAAMVLVTVGNVRILFSGDVGRPLDPIFRPPDLVPPCDYLVVESTYGDRAHPKSDPQEDLAQAIQVAAARKGTILIPAFAVGRTQTILFMLSELRRQNRIPDIPMYLNSPMAQNVTETFCQFRSLHRLSDAQCRQFDKLVHFVKTVEESKALNEAKGPQLIISASGMATGGRILHHLKQFAPDPKNMILLCGYQAAGTRGQSLQDGAEEIKIHGQMWKVGAEVRVIENLSAHADALEICDWLKPARLNPRLVFVTHGEEAAASALAGRLHEAFGWECLVPSSGQEFKLESVCPLLAPVAK